MTVHGRLCRAATRGRQVLRERPETTLPIALFGGGFAFNGNDDFGFFHRGDTATFKFCDIDKATYDFWRTWEFAFQSNGNPFSSPIKVIGNVSNDALGAFCGYAAQYSTIIIPK